MDLVMTFPVHSNLVRPSFWVSLMLLGIYFVFLVVPSYASLVIVNGRPIDTDVRPPFNPYNESECDAFREDARRTTKTLDDAHDQCLESNQGKGRSTEVEVRLPDGRKVARCTAPLCQGLHLARDEHRDTLAAAYSQCMADALGRSDGRSSEINVSSRSDKNDEKTYAFRRIAKGPIEGLVKHVKSEMLAAIERYFRDGSRLIHGGIRVSDATGFLLHAAQDMRSKCAEMKDAKLLNACDETLIDAMSNLPRKVPVQFRYDPSIELIQRAMIEKLQVITREMNANVDEIQTGMDEISVNLSAGQTPGRRTRRTPLIENK